MHAGGGHDCEYARWLLWREVVNAMGGGQRAPREVSSGWLASLIGTHHEVTSQEGPSEPRETAIGWVGGGAG